MFCIKSNFAVAFFNTIIWRYKRYNRYTELPMSQPSQYMRKVLFLNFTIAEYLWNV